MRIKQPACDVIASPAATAIMRALPHLQEFRSSPDFRVRRLRENKNYQTNLNRITLYLFNDLRLCFNPAPPQFQRSRQ